MASTATTLLLSATATLALPHASSTRLGIRSAHSQLAHGRQLGVALQVESRRRRGAVVCEVAVELNGSEEGTSSEGTSEQEEHKVGAGTKIRVLGPLKVYHVPKNPDLDIGGMEGVVKDVVTTFKGKPISATFPYKCQLATSGEESRKFFVHLKDDEFEVIE